MILRPPTSVVNFVRGVIGKARRFAPSHIVRMLPGVLAGIALMSGARHSLSGIAAEVFSERRDKSAITRMLRRRDFKTRDLHWETLKNALVALAPKLEPGRTVDWLVALDSTANQRGAFTRILGAILPKIRPEKLAKLEATGTKKGRKTKYFTFLCAILVTDKGVRIPLPRYTCDPTDFNRQGRPRRERQTQLDLAKLMLKQLLSILPLGVRLVVTADSYYESQKLTLFAQKNHFVFISPIDTNRCFAEEATPTKSNGQRIWDYGLELSEDSFTRLDLRRGSEDTACYRRYCERKPGPNDRRTYLLKHERRTVAKLGAVGIVYSWKTPVYEPKRNFRRQSFKVLMCSDPTWSGQKVVEWYECRWTAIEIVFRELKQYLGFGDYTGQNLQSLERYIDLVLITFLYLETERHNRITDPATPEATRRTLTVARTLRMQEIVRAEANRQLLREVKRSYQSQRPAPLVMAFVEAMTQPNDTRVESRRL